MKTGQRGITLVEVMIVCVIVALIAAVGLPWYGDHVRRGRVAEGVELGAVVRVKAAELVTIGQVKTSGVTERVMYSYMALPGFEPPPPPPEPDTEVVAENPTPYVTQVLRVDASYIVTYSANLDPQANEVYSIVYYANVDARNGTVSWDCMVGERARRSLGTAYQYSPADLGQPMPAKMAPAGCISS